MTPNGQAGTQYPQPLQMSSWTTTVPNSVRNSDPVGHTSRHPAWVQCLQTSEHISQRTGRDSAPVSAPGSCVVGMPSWTLVVSVPSALRSPVIASSAARFSSSLADGPFGVRASPSSCWPSRFGFSMNATWRHVDAPSAPVLS